MIFCEKVLFLPLFDDIFRDTSEDSEPEGTIPSNKELEKESPKIDFASDLSKSSLLVVEKDTEKETFAAVDSVNKRHLLDMDMEEETILVQTSLSSDVDRAPVIIKNNLENVPKVEVVLDVEEVITTFTLELSNYIFCVCQRNLIFTF